MGNNTLIIYGTRKGTTAETSEVIAKVLRDKYAHKVEVINVKDYRKVKKRIKEFNTIIIGSSIVSGQWKSKCLRILKSIKLKNQNLIIFITAGGTMNKIVKYGMPKTEVIREGMEKYIDPFIKKYKLEPFSKMVFGGKVIKKNKIRYNNWNADDIISWTSEIGNKLNQ